MFVFFWLFFLRKKNNDFFDFPACFLLDASREIFQLPQVRCHLCHFRQYALRHLGAARRRKVALSKKEEKTGVFTEYKYNDTPNCVYINKLIVHIIVLKIHFQQTMTITKKIYKNHVHLFPQYSRLDNCRLAAAPGKDISTYKDRLPSFASLVCVGKTGKPVVGMFLALIGSHP